MSEKPTSDDITSKKLLQKIKILYTKHKQSILYLFFGGISFILNSAIYILFTQIINMNIITANIITWILTVAFCFITNKKYVFANQEKSVIKQLINFYIGRLATLGIEELILYVFVICWQFNNIIIKIIAQTIVIVLNYLISKLLIFRKKG